MAPVGMRVSRPQPYVSSPGFPDPSREPRFGAPPHREWLWGGNPDLAQPSVDFRANRCPQRKRERTRAPHDARAHSRVVDFFLRPASDHRASEENPIPISVDVDELIEVQQRPGQFRFAAILRQAQRSHQLRIVRLPQ